MRHRRPRALGARLAERARASTGPVCVLLPLRGVSALSVPGGPFHDPAADAALFDAIRVGCGTAVEVVEHDCAVNDAQFARSLADRLAAWV